MPSDKQGKFSCRDVRFFSDFKDGVMENNKRKD